MSSILRALKKLENDPRHLGENGPLDSKFVPLADTGPQKVSPSIIMLVIGASIVYGLVIVAGWWLYSEKNQLRPGPPPVNSGQHLQQTEMVPAKIKKLESPESSTASHAPAKASSDNVIPQKIPAHIPESSPVKIQQPFPAANGQREFIKQLPAEEKAVAATRAPEVSSIAKNIEIPELDDPAIKLQAITWSKNPQKRIAIINNSILRQGEKVDNYRLDSINQDDVVLSDGGEKWKVLFRIK